MKNVLFVFLVLSQAAVCHAALAPWIQNEKDLDVLVTFVKDHQRILTTLSKIDLENYTIYYDKGCQVVFGRKNVLRPVGWTGPAAPLELKSSSCPFD